MWRRWPAVLGRHRRAATESAATALAATYHDFRNGLGCRKDPRGQGTFPTDPYSHTPRHLGAQQPGRTGQVKEQALSRSGELERADGQVESVPGAELDPEARRSSGDGAGTDACS